MTDILEGKKGGKSRPYVLILAAVALVAAAVVLVRLYERKKPLIIFRNDIERLGASQDLSFAITDAGSGIREIGISLVQDEKRVRIYHRTFPRQGYLANAGPSRVEDVLQVDARSLGFKDGTVEMAVTVRDYSFWNWMAGNEAAVTYPAVLDTKPPKVTINEWPRYIKPGGSGAVVYRLNEEITAQGVTINDQQFPGFAVGDKADRRFVALVAIPYDTTRIDKAEVYALDRAANKGINPFGMNLRKIPEKTDRINVSDNFLSHKLPEFGQYYPELTGEPLAQYLYVNQEIRKQNYLKIKEICSNPLPERLWRGAFKQMPRTSRRAGFAERRTYYYQGREIDKETHLGIDLASVQQAEVPAANRGKVVFADYLGIYGNTVILDHGQGLFSLYSHLSQINVNLEEMAETDTILGLTGTSGMAGGDHLHFSILVNGIFVDPLEWWDEKWLEYNMPNL